MDTESPAHAKVAPGGTISEPWKEVMDSWNDRLRKTLASRYTLDRLLGRGGSSLVFLAEDNKLRRLVAIKVLRRELAACSNADRFRREIRVLGCLQHPNIMPLYDSENVDGVAFYVMPYVRGETLSDRIEREARIPVAEAVSIARAVAGALECVHQHNIIHRDVTPANILIQAGHPYLLDFGIAHIKTGCTDGMRLTADNSCVGTAAYMSPEQASGQRVVDSRTDQYSLACVLYEMLTGRPPFVGNDRAVMSKHVTETPVRASILRPEIGRRLCMAITRALAKAPENRFESIRQFADALRVEDCVPTSPPKSIAVLPFTNMSGGPETEPLSKGITEDITNALARIEGLHVVARTSALSFNGSGHDVREVGGTLNVATLLEGSVRRSGSKVRITAQLINAMDGYHLWTGRYDREVGTGFAIEDEITRDVVSQLREKLGMSSTPIEAALS